MYTRNKEILETQKTIGFISYADPKDKTAWSGTIHHLYNSIENSGYNVIWIKARFSKWIKYYQKFLNRLSKQSNKHYSIAHTLLAAYLTRLDKKDFKKADILFSPGCTAIYKLKTDKPIIYLADATFKSIHNYYDEFSNLLSFNIREGNIIEKKVLTKATHIIHASDWAKQSAIIDYGIPNDKISVLEFGANITTQSYNKSQKKDQTLHILFLGVDWQRKGGDIAIETCKILNAQGIKSIIHIIGPVETPKSCKGIPYIDFIGFLNKNDQCDYEKIIQYMSSSDILLLPTKAECAGIVFAEASAYSMPIFTYDTGGISNYVINGINGYRLPLKSDSNEFASKIKNCIMSGELIQMQGYAANLYKEKLNWALWSKRFKKIIENI